MRKKISLLLTLLVTMFIGANAIIAETYPNFQNSVVSCGNITNIPSKIPQIISIGVIIIQIAVPVLLVIFGMLDLFKGIMAQKEDEIKKGQQIFIKRLISGALVFFVFVIVKVVISFAADNASANIIDCMDCFISNKCKTKKS